MSEVRDAVDAVGALTGVGLGPGDPDLITLKGLRAIKTSDVVFVPTRREGQVSYALEIASELIDRRRQEVVTIPFPETSVGGWDVPCRTIAAALAGGRRGVFLTEGDPGLYSTFGHVAEALRRSGSGIRVEVVPGVSSITAAAAAAGISLADYGERVAIVPASHGLQTLPETLRAFECVVLIKVSPVLPEVIELLDRLEVIEQAVYVRRCGRPDQEIVRDLRRLAVDPPRDYFALIVVRRAEA